MITIEQLKQRKIAQWAVAYLAGAWLIMQVIGWLAAVYGWPNLVLRMLPVALGVGFLAVLVLAWYHGEAGRQRVSAPELIMIAGILLLAGIGLAFVRRGDHAPGALAAPNANIAVKAEQGSIAVLPFTDLSAKKDQMYFSDGLTEELLNVLAQIPELRVAARTSSFSFRDKSVAVDSIGRALHVEYVLEGSVRTAGEQVRITAQLVNAATGFHLWSNTYDRHVKDIFAVQDEISRSIVQTLRLKLASNKDTTSLARAGTANPEAHELVMKGTFKLGLRSVDEVQAAVDLYKQAIAHDSGYAGAYVGLSNALQYQAYRRYIPADAGYAQAKAAAQKALELDPNLAEAHSALARILDLHDWDFAGAEKQFKRAIELNPGLADAHMFRSWLLMRLGRADESVAEAQRAVQLNMVAPNAYNTLGSMYSYVHRVNEAIEAYKNALAYSSNRQIVECNLMLTYIDARRFDEALKLADAQRAAGTTDLFSLSSIAYVYANAGRRADAEKAVAELMKQKDASPYLVATSKVGLGQTDEVFRLLARAVAEHDDYVPDLGVDPVFDPVRNDPRMTRLLQSIGLPVKS